MSEFSLVEQLKFLVKTREQITALKEQINEFQAKINSKKEQLVKFEKVLNFEKNNFANISKSLDLCELEANEIRQKEDERKALLDQETKEVVRKAIFTELRNLENLRFNLENKLEALWAEKEKTQRNLSTIKEESARRINELERELADLIEQKDKICTQIPALELEDKKILNALSKEWSERLESMSHQSSKSLIAKVVNGLCGSCFYPISSRDIGELLKGSQDIIECKSCFRLLYIEPEEKASN